VEYSENLEPPLHFDHAKNIPISHGLIIKDQGFFRKYFIPKGQKSLLIVGLLERLKIQKRPSSALGI
jgi:hypothetical protein